MKHNIIVKFKCDKCANEFNEKDQLTKHIYDIHEFQLLRCDLCKFVVNDKTIFDAHLQAHDADVTIEYKNCSFCSYKALHDSDLRIHNQTFHDNQAIILSALTVMSESIQSLSADVFELKSNSIIVDKDVYRLIKIDAEDEIKNGVADKFDRCIS